MRALVFLAFLILAAAPACATQDRIERPQVLTIGFKTGDRVTFTIADAVITAVTLHIGSADYEIPAAECAKLRDVRFESVALLWTGAYEQAANANYFCLRFDMGTESARAFGGLPQVQLTFRGGKFDRASVRKNIAQDTSQGFDL